MKGEGYLYGINDAHGSRALSEARSLATSEARYRQDNQVLFSSPGDGAQTGMTKPNVNHRFRNVQHHNDPQGTKETDQGATLDANASIKLELENRSIIAGEFFLGRCIILAEEK